MRAEQLGQQADLRAQRRMHHFAMLDIGDEARVGSPRGNRPARGPSSARCAPTGGPCADSPTARRSAAAATLPARPCRCARSCPPARAAWRRSAQAASRCCSEQPLHSPKCRQRGSTRCGERVISSTTSASSKWRWRLRNAQHDLLAQQRAADEDGLAIDAGHATAVVAEVGDGGFEGRGWHSIGSGHERSGRLGREAGRRLSQIGPITVDGGAAQALTCCLPGARGVLVIPACLGAFSIQPLAKVARICDSHSGWPLALATSR